MPLVTGAETADALLALAMLDAHAAGDSQAADSLAELADNPDLLAEALADIGVQKFDQTGKPVVSDVTPAGHHGKNAPRDPKTHKIAHPSDATDAPRSQTGPGDATNPAASKLSRAERRQRQRLRQVREARAAIRDSAAAASLYHRVAGALSEKIDRLREVLGKAESATARGEVAVKAAAVASVLHLSEHGIESVAGCAADWAARSALASADALESSAGVPTVTAIKVAGYAIGQVLIRVKRTMSQATAHAEEQVDWEQIAEAVLYLIDVQNEALGLKEAKRPSREAVIADLQRRWQ